MVARNRIVLSGKMGVSTSEVWSVGINAVLDGGGALTTQGECQAWANYAATLLSAGETELSSVVSQWGTGTDATRLDVYGYDASGPAVAHGQAAVALSGSGTARLPFQDAICVSLLTDFAGSSYRGRMYLPAHAATVASSGRWAAPAGFLADVADMLEMMVSIDALTTAIPVVYSPTKNAVTTVTRLRVGDVIDTQRRRRDALVESYQSVDFTV